MYECHRLTIDRMAERYGADPGALALIVVGSVARGDPWEDSDIDAYLIVSDDEYARRRESGELGFSADVLCEPPCHEAGGTVVDKRFLLEAAAHGPEPTRFAFLKAIVAFSRLPKLDAVVRLIPVYQDGERREKMESFASQLPVHFSYLELGEYSDNAYILNETAVQIALFGGRLILAYNRMLYPNRKQFLRQLDLAPEKPAEMLALMDALLRRPSIANARAFYDAILGFADWPHPKEGAWERYARDSERHWLGGRAPVADW